MVPISMLLFACGGESVSTVDEVEILPPNNSVNAAPNVIVFFTDDQGWSDVGYHGAASDVKTPNIDALAQSGVRFSNGYITAPQCSPSRAAMHTGIYQQRFGMDDNKFVPMPLGVTSVAERFKKIGYKTGMVGKWHLDISRLSFEWLSNNYPEINPIGFSSDQIPFDVRTQYFASARGYQYVFTGNITRFWRNFDVSGSDTELGYFDNPDYRINVVSDAADAFIRKHARTPFYLHVAHFGPHVPIEAPERYLSQFDQNMPTRRRYALATLKAMDDGVGKVLATLDELNLRDNTLIIFISDNGAPLGVDQTDAPISDAREQWNGSTNVPMRGEKGMLSEGGIRVPYLLSMPRLISQNMVIDQPVSSLDAIATALKLAEPQYDLLDLDGVDLMPAVTGSADYLDERALYWRFWGQQAIRKGQWKYLEVGNQHYLFDMLSVDPESNNLVDTFPEIAQQLNAQYKQWSATLMRPDDPSEVSDSVKVRYDIHLNPNRTP